MAREKKVAVKNNHGGAEARRNELDSSFRWNDNFSWNDNLEMIRFWIFYPRPWTLDPKPLY